MTDGGTIRLGNGDNTVSIGGDHDGSLRVFGGSGDDSVELTAGASLTDSLLLNVGTGNNLMEIEGDINSMLRVRADGGVNNLVVRPESTVGSLSVLTDAAQNYVLVRGNVVGDAFIHSQDFANEGFQETPRHETTTIIEGDVGGNLDVWMADGSEHSLFATGSVGGNFTAGGFDNADRTFVSTVDPGGNLIMTTDGEPAFIGCDSNETQIWAIGVLSCVPVSI